MELMQVLQIFGDIVENNCILSTTVQMRQLRLRFMSHVRCNIPKSWDSKDRRNRIDQLTKQFDNAYKVVDLMNVFGTAALLHHPDLKEIKKIPLGKWDEFRKMAQAKLEKKLERRAIPEDDKAHFIRNKALKELKELGYPDDHMHVLHQSTYRMMQTGLEFVQEDPTPSS